MHIVQYPDGLLINDEFPHCLPLIQHYLSHIPLILTDPPYGGIVKDCWDNVYFDDVSFANWLTNCISVCQSLQKDGDSLYFFAGSATCAIAAVQNKRRFICVEKDETIFEKAKERLDTYYGAI